MPNRIEAQAEPIPGYRLLERLGGGGFGEVWKAEAPGGLLKAIKFVYGDLETVDNEETVRASQELRSLERVKSVRHPFILSIERYEIVNGQLLIVTELADRSLWDRFRECRAQGMPGIPRPELLSYLQETAEALDLMNQQYDLMHLDIKPQNLFLVHNHVKVADFGLVKDLEGLVASVTGGITPVYAAPETFDGYISRFSDQYSLAIVFQELLTGHRPFTGNNTRQLILQHMEGKPKLDPLPKEDQPVVAKALSRDPNNRYPSCAEFIQALKSSDIGLRTTPSLTNVADTQVGTASASSPSASYSGSHFVVQDSAGRAVITPYGSVPTTGHASTQFPPLDGASEPLTTQFNLPNMRARQVRVEKTGPGVLQPALVLGLGQMGRVIVDFLKLELQSRYGLLSGLPHLKLYAIDTDATVPPLLAESPNANNEELVLLKLNRPARYLRPRDTLPPVEQWLDTNILYRMPRSQTPSGLRALGRLALMEYARSLGVRFRRDLEQIASEEAIATACQHLEVELKSNFPRVFVIAALGGGTGSGMYLDTAYLIRNQLRELGYPKCDVEAILLLPPVDAQHPPDIPHSNSFAALIELHHFMQAGQGYQVRLETGVDPLVDTEAPFQRVCLMNLPDGRDSAALLESLKVVTNYLGRMLLTPLGTAADSVRRQLHPSTPYHSTGVRVLASPRRPLIRRTGRRLSQMLVERWLRPLPLGLEETITEPIRTFLREQDLDPTGIFEQLEAAVRVELGGRGVDDALREILAPHMAFSETGFPENRRIKSSLDQCEALLGKIGESANSLNMPTVLRAAIEAGERLVRQGGPALVRTLIRFVDLPGLRLGATEEAIRQAVTCFDSWLTLYEDQSRTLGEQHVAALEKLKADLLEFDRLRAKGDRKRAAQLGPVGPRIHKAFILRYHQILHERLLGIYVSFRGFCSDQNKELRFTRSKLTDLLHMLQDIEDYSSGPSRPGLRQTSSVLLPKGCRSLVQAVTDFLASVGDEELEQLDRSFAAAMERTMLPLSELCVAAGDALRPIRTLLQQEAEKHLEQKLELTDAAGLFLERQPDEQAAADALMTTFDETLPLLIDSSLKFSAEFGLLLAPNTSYGYDLKTLAMNALPQVQTVLTPDGDEVVMYREIIGIQLSDLKLLSPQVRAAYEMALDIDHYTPHSRQDVAVWFGPQLT